jgi:hypothetical protein
MGNHCTCTRTKVGLESRGSISTVDLKVGKGKIKSTILYYTGFVLFQEKKKTLEGPKEPKVGGLEILSDVLKK